MRFGSLPAREHHTGPPFLAEFSGLDLAARPDYAALFKDMGTVFRSTADTGTSAAAAAAAAAAAYCIGTRHVDYTISPLRSSLARAPPAVGVFRLGYKLVTLDGVPLLKRQSRLVKRLLLASSRRRC